MEPRHDHGPGLWAAIGGGVIALAAVPLVIGGVEVSGPKDPPVLDNAWIRGGLVLAIVGAALLVASTVAAMRGWWRHRAGSSSTPVEEAPAVEEGSTKWHAPGPPPVFSHAVASVGRAVGPDGLDNPWWWLAMGGKGPQEQMMGGRPRQLIFWPDDPQLRGQFGYTYPEKRTTDADVPWTLTEDGAAVLTVHRFLDDGFSFTAHATNGYVMVMAVLDSPPRVDKQSVERAKRAEEALAAERAKPAEQVLLERVARKQTEASRSGGISEQLRQLLRDGEALLQRTPPSGSMTMAAGRFTGEPWSLNPVTEQELTAWRREVAAALHDHPREAYRFDEAAKSATRGVRLSLGVFGSLARNRLEAELSVLQAIFQEMK